MHLKCLPQKSLPVALHYPNHIFKQLSIEQQPPTLHLVTPSVGAASSLRIPDDVAPERSFIHLRCRCYNDSSLTDFAAVAPCTRQNFNRPSDSHSILHYRRVRRRDAQHAKAVIRTRNSRSVGWLRLKTAGVWQVCPRILR